MLKPVKFATLALLSALAVQPALAEEKAAALVNGVAIPQARIDFQVKGVVAQGQPDSPDLRKAIKEKMIEVELIVQEATRLGLDKNSDVSQQIEISRRTVLASAFIEDFVKNHPISEDQLKQEYDKLKAKLGDKEYNARHILVASEDEAKAIIAQLGKKVKFEKLAAKSLDAGSAKQGGSLGWTIPGTFVQPFAEALLSLKKGEYTKTPVQTQFGWHVIRLDDVRALKVPSFDEVKPQLQQRLQQQALKKAVDDLRTKAKIE
ncbi:MAG: peptidyl-prolyl cis-trans isomerase [Gallionella sp.]|nr:peptidyl-prolyl cis-trans isomerase [Gallionella sp.]